MKFSKKKQILFKGLALFVFSLNLFAQGLRKSSDSELNIFNEANSAFHTGFYPGAVDKADLLIKNYPESVFIIPASVLKGESLVYLGRYDQAAEVFTKIIPAIHLGDENYERSFFFLGKALFYSKNYNDAVKAFFESCKAAVSQNYFKYYDQSMLFAARCLFVTENYEKAIPVMEYLISNPNAKSHLTKDDYDEILQKILISYNKSGAYKKAVDLYNTLNKTDFADEIYDRIVLQAAFAYEGADDLETAYNLYCKIIEDGIKELAVVSLKYAYLITTKNTNVDSLELFEITKKVFGSTSIVCEFWVRLGIDSYFDKDYESATNYFISARENNPAEFACVISLYENKIALQTLSNELSEIEQNLEKLENSISQSAFDKIQDVYYSTLVQCYALNNKWEKVISAYEKIESKDNQNLYYYCLALYNTKAFADADELLANQTSVKFVNLYAKNAVAAGDLKKAKSAYEKLISLASVNPEISLDSVKNEYCKVLYQLGEWENCLNHCREIIYLNDAKYIAGLCSVKLKQWKNAISFFEDFTKALKNDKNQFYYIAVYYLGYSNYVTGTFENAYKYFARYNEASGDVVKNYSAQAYEFGAKSALQLRRYSQAASQAEGLINVLKDEKAKQNAIMFTSEIYVDGGNYKSAIALLKPWLEEKGDFSADCMLKTAQIYQKSGNLEQAEIFYENLVSEYGKSIQAEESLFACGEMYYSAGNYEKAEDKFSRYIYKYVDGKFAENALFFSGDCNFKLKKYDRSVMLNNRLCQKYTKSVYLYGAYKNLLESNYVLQNYTAALNAAKFLNSSFETQAKADGIPRRIIELEKVIAGLDTSAAKKFSEFEQKGGIKTVAGRHAGTDLVQLYITDESTKNEGIILALQLLPLEQGNLSEEVADAAKNAILIADWYRSKNSSKEAAQYYLLAAEYFRGSGETDDLKPASALYSAAESFVAEGMTGDARETANLLKSLYPKTPYASAVDRLIY